MIPRDTTLVDSVPGPDPDQYRSKWDDPNDDEDEDDEELLLEGPGR